MIKRLSIISTAVLAALLIAGLAWASSSDSSSSSSTTTTTLAQSDATGSQATVGSQSYEAGAAGQVTVEQSGASLSVTDVAANDGWALEVEQATGREVEVKFVDGNERIDFQAELEDGLVKTRVRTRTLDNPADDNQAMTAFSDDVLQFNAGEAGTVQLSASDGALQLINATPNADWTVADIEIEGSREINVEFRNGATEIEFKAEIEDGMVKTRVRTETDDDSNDDSDDSSGHSGDDDDTSDDSGKDDSNDDSGKDDSNDDSGKDDSDDDGDNSDDD